MLPDCARNPLFCRHARVRVRYCDGFSFAGDREGPLYAPVDNDKDLGGNNANDKKKQPLYFHGRRILEAVLDSLIDGGGAGDLGFSLLD